MNGQNAGLRDATFSKYKGLWIHLQHLMAFIVASHRLQLFHDLPLPFQPNLKATAPSMTTPAVAGSSWLDFFQDESLKDVERLRDGNLFS